MQYIVRQEAGPEYDALGERLQQIAASTAPLVAEVTGLALPESLIIHTVTLQDWQRILRISSKQQLAAEALELGARSRIGAELLRHVRLVAHRRLWRLLSARVVTVAPGHCELIIIPEVLRHCGHLDDGPVLHKIVAHETAHLAQSNGATGVWAAHNSFFPGQRGIWNRDYHYLVEGHADWADQQITTELFGSPVRVDEVRPNSSARNRKFKSSLREVARMRQRHAVADITQIVSAHGLSGFNRVWTTPDLVPLRSESKTPDTWPCRFA
ncbi:MAG TPA: zinc-dependent metalloprotease [Streptomyces sp.]